ncbi:hypothetical protein TYRP_018317 [Tyrophagus putrescentiae]|nr:hypothetical protein TYRP_018317 [Tyrophagus putrescentiae]
MEPKTLVGGLAGVDAKVAPLGPPDAQHRVDVVVGGLHDGNLVVGRVLHLDAVQQPANGRRGVGLHAAVQVGVVAKCLLVAAPLHVHAGRELHLDEDVPPGARVDVVVGDAEVGAPVGLGDVVDDEDVALVDGAAGRQEAVVLAAPADTGLRVAGGVALQLNRLSGGGDHRAGAVVRDEGRNAHVDVHV